MTWQWVIVIGIAGATLAAIAWAEAWRDRRRCNRPCCKGGGA